VKKMLIPFLTFLIFVFCSSSVFADSMLVDRDKEYEQGEIIYNDFQGEGYGDELNISEKKGLIEININVLENRPIEFQAYDFVISFMDLDNYLEYYVTVEASDNYNLVYELPYGNYIVTSSGAKGDTRGKFQIVPLDKEEFTISEEMTSITFGFHGINGSTGEKQETINVEDLVPQENEKDYSQFIKVIGIFMILTAVVILFCIFFLVSMKKFNNRD